MGPSRIGLTVRAAAVAALTMTAVAGISSQASAESLSSALASAYRYNPEIDAERARLRATDESVAIAMSGYRPTINSALTAGVEGSNSAPDVFTEGTSAPRTFSVTLSQPLFTGFVTTNAVSQAEANVRSGQQALRIVEQNVLQAAATAYVDVVRDLALLRLQQSNVEFLTRELQATQDRFEVGEVTRTDVAQARARRAAAISDLSSARAALKSSQATYRQVIGRQPRRLREPPVPTRKLPKSLESALSVGLQENPFVVQALYDEQAARFNVDQLIGALLPSASLEAEYSVTNDPNPITDRSERGSVIGRLSIPIYQGGENRARVRQAKQTHISTLQVIEQRRTEVRQNIIATWSAYLAARDQLQSDLSQVEANQIALEGVREEERVGQRTLLDVLDAQQELLNAQVSLTATKRNIIVNAYAVLAAVGRLDGTAYGVADIVYDPDQHYHDVRAEWFKISITDRDGAKYDVNTADKNEWVRDNAARAAEQKKAVLGGLVRSKHEKVADKTGKWSTETNKAWHVETHPDKSTKSAWPSKVKPAYK